VAAAQLENGEALVEKIKTDWLNADLSLKLKALLNIAGKVQQDGKLVSTEDIASVRQEGATDREIHDTVLIAAVFSMCNRYVVYGPGATAQNADRRPIYADCQPCGPCQFATIAELTCGQNSTYHAGQVSLSRQYTSGSSRARLADLKAPQDAG
jgi:hypothetical protein